jgi:hypothetical protein
MVVIPLKVQLDAQVMAECVIQSKTGALSGVPLAVH